MFFPPTTPSRSYPSQPTQLYLLFPVLSPHPLSVSKSYHKTKIKTNKKPVIKKTTKQTMWTSFSAGNGACNGVWLVDPEILHWRKPVFPLPVD